LKSQIAVAEARQEAQDAEKARLDAEIERLEDEILTAKAVIQKAERLAREAAELEANLAEINAQLETKNAKLATFDAEVEKAAAARFAGLGGDPLPESGGSNTEFSGLTGLARAQAVHKAQAKQSNPSNQ
jgi:DNA repair exonuclease SbcCD ATPase subunit